MPDEDKPFRRYLVLDLRIWRRHVYMIGLVLVLHAFSQAFTVDWFRWRIRDEQPPQTAWPENDWPRQNNEAQELGKF